MNDYFDDVPGFSGAAVDWLFDERHILGVGADTFGPDATFDPNFAATTEATGRGGITLENMGPGLASDAGVRRLDRAERAALHDHRCRAAGASTGIQRRADGDDRLHRLAVAPSAVSVD